jgi:hypothetical protein
MGVAWTAEIRGYARNAPAKNNSSNRSTCCLCGNGVGHLDRGCASVPWMKYYCIYPSWSQRKTRVVQSATLSQLALFVPAAPFVPAARFPLLVFSSSTQCPSRPCYPSHLYCPFFFHFICTQRLFRPRCLFALLPNVFFIVVVAVLPFPILPTFPHSYHLSCLRRLFRLRRLLCPRREWKDYVLPSTGCWPVCELAMSLPQLPSQIRNFVACWKGSPAGKGRLPCRRSTRVQKVTHPASQ